MTRRMALMLLLLAGLLLPAQPLSAQTDERCFPETGFCISGPIRAYWERNGGLSVFGYPKTGLTSETVEGVALAVQWFERDRIEIQPDGRVSAGRLGAEILALQGTPWQFGSGSPPAPSGCQVFAETGHQVCGAFADYWRANGGVERFGYPISGEFAAVVEGRNLSVQYFERRRFEWHPMVNNGSVLLGLLGNEVIAARAAGAVMPPAAAAPAPAPVPEPAPAPAPAAEQPIVISGNGRQNFTVTVPFKVGRVIMDVQNYGPWGTKFTDAEGRDVLIFAERQSRQNSASVIGSGNTYSVEAFSNGPWTLTIRPFGFDHAAARGFFGAGRGASDYFYVKGGQYTAILLYDGSIDGFFTVDLLCSSFDGYVTLVDRVNVRSVDANVPVTIGEGLCNWQVQALGGFYGVALIGP